MNSPSVSPRSNLSSGKAKNRTLWALQALVSAGFLFIGFAKLSSQPMPVELFDKLGFGQWPRFATGAIEVSGALLVLLPRTAWIGACLLVCAMIGAVTAHLTVLGGSPVAAIVLGGLSGIIAWGRRPSRRA